jgi:hypothetical protein
MNTDTKGDRPAGTAWSVAGAIAVQSAAHAVLERAIAEERTFGVYIGAARIVTCASRRAAEMYVGKSKKYTIIADFQESHHA